MSKGLVERFLERLAGHPGRPCVICGELAEDKYGNSITGKQEYVHAHHEKSYAGCLEVWRYRQRLGRKQERAGHIFSSWFFQDDDYDEADLPDERDSYNDYKTYIASREWEVRADSLKQVVKWTCEECGRKGNRTTIHVHHKHYKTLYKERRKDLQIVCNVCHQGKHKKKGR